MVELILSANGLSLKTQQALILMIKRIKHWGNSKTTIINERNLNFNKLINSNEFCLSGRREGCTEEGEIVPKENIKINSEDLTCFTCLCKVNNKYFILKERKKNRQGRGV